MRYLCLAYVSGDCAETTGSAGGAIDEDDDLRSMLANGRLLAGGVLECGPPTAIIETGTGELRVDGETAAPLRPAAFLLISARDLNDAIRIATRLGSRGRWRGARMELLPVREGRE